MKIEGIIFDWAGTTVDYGCFAPVQAFAEVFHAFGMEVTMEETRKPMGMLKRDHIKTMLEMPRIKRLWKSAHGRAVTEADIDAMHDTFTEKLMSILDQFADPKPYVVETIARLRAMGLAIGSTTGYTDQMMAVVTRVAKEKGYAPDFWISPNSVDNYGRPYPYMIFENLKQLHIRDVHAAVKVGDTISDIKGGVAAYYEANLYLCRYSGGKLSDGADANGIRSTQHTGKGSTVCTPAKGVYTGRCRLCSAGYT